MILWRRCESDQRILKEKNLKVSHAIYAGLNTFKPQSNSTMSLAKRDGRSSRTENMKMIKESYLSPQNCTSLLLKEALT